MRLVEEDPLDRDLAPGIKNAVEQRRKLLQIPQLLHEMLENDNFLDAEADTDNCPTGWHSCPHCGSLGMLGSKDPKKLVVHREECPLPKLFALLEEFPPVTS